MVGLLEAQLKEAFGEQFLALSMTLDSDHEGIVGAPSLLQSLSQSLLDTR